MGVTRREFLKMAAAAAAATAANPLQAILIDDDRYINQRLGLSFAKPNGWHYESLKSFKELRNEYSVATHNEVLKEEMNGWNMPIVTIAKFPLNEKIGPSIVVYVEHNELEEGESLLSVMPMIQDCSSTLFKNYSRVGNYRAGKLSNCETVEYLSEFIYERKIFKPLEVRNRSLCSVRDPVMYTIHMMDMPSRQIDAQAEFDEFIRSIIYI
jgi:hypothetical protein